MCPTGVGEEPRIHWGMLRGGQSLETRVEVAEEQHTVDVGAGRERGVERERLGYVVVGSIDIVVFLGSKEQASV